MAPERSKKSSLVGNATTPLVEKALRGELDELKGGQMFSTNHCRAKLAAERVAEGLPVVKHRNGKIDLGIFLEETVQSEFVCHYCNHSFSYKSVLERHVKRIHEKHLMPNFKCPSCDYNTVWKDQLRSHYSVVHQNIKPFGCSECPFRAPKACRVVSHISKCHAGVGKSIRAPDEKQIQRSDGTPREAKVSDVGTKRPAEETIVSTELKPDVEDRQSSAGGPQETDELSGFDIDE